MAIEILNTLQFAQLDSSKVAQIQVPTGVTPVAADVTRFQTLMNAPATNTLVAGNAMQANAAAVSGMAQEYMQPVENKKRRKQQDSAVNASLRSENQEDSREPRTTVGDAVLDSFQRLSSDFEKSFENFSAAMDFKNKQIGIAELMQTQVSVLRFSIEYELISKAMTKTAQNFDQLVRIQ